jgi:D-alanine-D-alanine ligase
MVRHVAVLKGGLSSEREVSLNTAKAVAQAVHELGYKVTEIDVGFDVAAQLAAAKPDVAFVALHGTYGEDGCIQGVLEFLKIPYTHSGVRASAVAMDKPTAKILFESVGIPCAKAVTATTEEVAKAELLARPYVVKPVDEGSSVGVIVVEEGDNRSPQEIASVFRPHQKLMVETFIAGRELTVGVLEGEALGVIEIRPKQGFYDYKNKYTAGNTEYIPLTEKDEPLIVPLAMKLAERAHQVLGCRGVSRADIRCTPSGDLYMLEVNTHPGMTATSLVPKLAKNMGMSFNELVDRLIHAAALDHA